MQKKDREELSPIDLLARAGMTGNTGEIVDAFRDLFLRNSSATLFIWREKGIERTLSHGEFRRAVIGFKDWICDLRLPPHSRIALISESKPHWCIAFLAIGIAGHIVVPLEPRLTPEETATLIGHSDPALILVSVSSEASVEKALQIHGKSVRIHRIDGMERGENLISYKECSGEHCHPLYETSLDDVALIAYTSGTSSAPKGVMLTFRTLWFQVISLARTFKSKQHDVILSMLPLNHLLELSGGFLTALFTKCQIVFANSYLPDEIVELIRRYRVTQVVTVPLFLEQLQGRLLRKVERSNKMTRAVFKMSLQGASMASPEVRRRILFRRVHRAFGGTLERIICGGAPLRQETALFFEQLGLNVYQGYGLTETGPVIAVNRPGINRLGSVGQPLEAVRVKIETSEGTSGEILVKGPNVMRGYYKAPEATKEVLLENGWLRTGDVGYLDDEGYLWVTGRSKNIVVLAGGKKVSLEEVEEALIGDTRFREVCALGIQHQSNIGEQLVMVVRLAEEVARPDHLDVEVWLDEEVRRLTANLAAFKRPARVLAFERDFPKTSTRKIQRQRLVQLLREEGKL